MQRCGNAEIPWLVNQSGEAVEVDAVTLIICIRNIAREQGEIEFSVPAWMRPAPPPGSPCCRRGHVRKLRLASPRSSGGVELREGLQHHVFPDALTSSGGYSKAVEKVVIHGASGGHGLEFRREIDRLFHRGVETCGRPDRIIPVGRPGAVAFARARRPCEHAGVKRNFQRSAVPRHSF